MNPAASVPWVAGDVGAGGIPVFVLVRCALCVITYQDLALPFLM